MSNNEATAQPGSSPVESQSALGLGPALLGALAIGAAVFGLLTWRSRTLSEDTSRSKPLPIANPLALALGAAALAAVAIGAVAIGYLAVGRLVIGKARIRELEVDDLTIQRLHVVERDGPTA
jgi:predicted transporter